MPALLTTPRALLVGVRSCPRTREQRQERLEATEPRDRLRDDTRWPVGGIHVSVQRQHLGVGLPQLLDHGVESGGVQINRGDLGVAATLARRARA